MPTSQATEVERIRQLVAQADAGEPATAEARATILDELEQYECWAPFFRLIRRSIEDTNSRQTTDFIRLARVQNLHLEDVFAAADTCASLVAGLQIGYAEFTEQVLPRVVEFEDFAAEATILSAVCERFRAQADVVACLERLCMLYEKKTHNESQLNRTYERLLEVDAHNVKALRYFKLVYTQSGDWDEVLAILRTLLTCVNHPQELFRFAQELAAIHLYQLDQAEEAIRVLETYCSDSPLDTSTIMFEAYQRLAHWPGCLRVLRQCLLTVDDHRGVGVLHFKIANLHEQLGELDAAVDHYTKAVASWPELLDALEGLITIAVGRKDWSRVEEGLAMLAARVEDEKLGAQLKQAMTRLKDGLRLPR